MGEPTPSDWGALEQQLLDEFPEESAKFDQTIRRMNLRKRIKDRLAGGGTRR